jgi:hypothetical protein
MAEGRLAAIMDSVPVGMTDPNSCPLAEKSKCLAETENFFKML